jgi:CrcB protein
MKLISGLIYIFIGGGLGAILRYSSSSYIKTVTTTYFPVETLIVNTIGSLIIGFLFNTFQTYSVATDSEVGLFLMMGFVASFTTFSTYSLDTIQRLLDGHWGDGILNILLNNGLCLISVLIGIYLSKAVNFIITHYLS